MSFAPAIDYSSKATYRLVLASSPISRKVEFQGSSNSTHKSNVISMLTSVPWRKPHSYPSTPTHNKSDE